MRQYYISILLLPLLLIGCASILTSNSKVVCFEANGIEDAINTVVKIGEDYNIVAFQIVTKVDYGVIMSYRVVIVYDRSKVKE